jgi:hypothetical protein
MDVVSDYDKAARFSEYRTYSIEAFRAPDDVSPMNRERVVDAIRSEMSDKGFIETDSPDMLVHVAVIFQGLDSATAVADYYGYGGRYRPYVWGNGLGLTNYTTYSVENYIDGSLIIDIADAQTRKLLWEGIGNEEIYQENRDPVTEIPAAVKKIMKSFPPGK